MIGLIGKFYKRRKIMMMMISLWIRRFRRPRMVKDGQDKSSSAQDQDELKKKNVYRAMRLLESSFNPEAFIVLQNIDQGREIVIEQANIALFSGIVIDEEPSTFDEEWNHVDPKTRGKWWDAIKKELNDMDKQ
jgi:hypothetical protein